MRIKVYVENSVKKIFLKLYSAVAIPLFRDERNVEKQNSGFELRTSKDMKSVTLPLELTTSIAALVSLHLCTIRDLPGDRMMPSEDSFWLRLEVLLSDRKKSIFHPIQKISSNKGRFTKEGRRAEGATTHVRTSKVRTISPTDTIWP